MDLLTQVTVANWKFKPKDVKFYYLHGKITPYFGYFDMLKMKEWDFSESLQYKLERVRFQINNKEEIKTERTLSNFLTTPTTLYKQN